jgi:hypothetical protein
VRTEGYTPEQRQSFYVGDARPFNSERAMSYYPTIPSMPLLALRQRASQGIACWIHIETLNASFDGIFSTMLLAAL